MSSLWANPNVEAGLAQLKHLELGDQEALSFSDLTARLATY